MFWHYNILIPTLHFGVKDPLVEARETELFHGILSRYRKFSGIMGKGGIDMQLLKSVTMAAYFTVCSPDNRIFREER